MSHGAVGATVALKDTQNGGNNQTATTNGSGDATFTLTGSYNGSRCVDGTATATLSGFPSHSAGYTIQPGKTTQLAIQLANAPVAACTATLRVAVYDQPNFSHGAVGATVMLKDTQNGNNNQTRTTNASGDAVFTLAGTFNGSRCVDGTATASLTGYASAAADYTVQPNQTTQVALSLTSVPPNVSSAPFGGFDSPAGDGTALAGSIAVSGWALDNMGVTRVELWRDLVSGETTTPFAGSSSDPRAGKVFIGNAIFVDGARPDVEVRYPTTPMSFRAGWGYLLMTWGLWNQGNGADTLYAFAFDQDSNVTNLGSKRVVVNNNAATKPFGSIDTPSYGGDAGTFPNFGWALTPKVNGAATCRIPAGGVRVSIDSGPLMPVVYGDARTDIAGLFPGFSNSASAGGHFEYDWSSLKVGIHTIGWLVTDDCNRTDGVGSRFFNVATGVQAVAGPAVAAGLTASSTGVLATLSESDAALLVTRGHDALPVALAPAIGGRRAAVELATGERVEILAPRGFDQIHQLVAGELRRLPAGASFDSGASTLFWQPAPGFLGTYRFVFSNGRERINVRVIVRP